MSNLIETTGSIAYDVLTHDSHGEELYRSQYESWEDANEIKEMYESNTVRANNGQTHHILIERSS